MTLDELLVREVEIDIILDIILDEEGAGRVRLEEIDGNVDALLVGLLLLMSKPRPLGKGMHLTTLSAKRELR